MFYKIRNLLAVILSCGFVFAISHAKAQGVVSLSEEAMFDDELDNKEELPALEQPASNEAPKIMPKGPMAETPAQMVVPNAPSEAQKVMPKGPMAPDNSSSAFPSLGKSDNNIFASATPDVVSDDIFMQMSDLEKRTALLNLELRREKLQTDIEAVKDARRQALIAEEEKAEERRLKSIEFEKEQERKVIEEQEKLRALDIKFETLRQEKVLGAYKNKMLEDTQKWIEHDAQFYKQIAELRKSKQDLADDLKNKLATIKEEAQKARTLHNVQIEGYKKEIRDSQAQISVLRSRIETLEKERDEARQNPFAGGVTPDNALVNDEMMDASLGSNIASVSEPQETDLTQLYAVTEIRGQGGELIAKIINKNGTPFYVKKGTVLQSGHVVTNITTTYVLADKDGDRKYLYLAAGGVLPAETGDFDDKKDNGNSGASKKKLSKEKKAGSTRPVGTNSGNKNNGNNKNSGVIAHTL